MQRYTPARVPSRSVQAWVLRESPGDYQWADVDTPELAHDDVRVEVVASALNHMDLWLTRGMPKPDLPHVPGCDVAGRLDDGTEVVVNPAVSCRRCDVCLAGESPLCRDFQIVGEHRWGGHGSHLVVPAANVTSKPANLSWEEAAAYPLAYLTAWRMLRRARLRAGETVLVVGVGGGVSSAALVLAKAMGARVVGTSREASKRETAITLGAEDAFDSSGDWPVKADVVVENVGPATWQQSIRALARGGRLVTCGGTSGQKVELSLPRLFYSQQEIIGSTMGSYQEFAEVTRMVAGGVPVVVDETFGLDEYPKALDRLSEGAQLGKIVLRHV